MAKDKIRCCICGAVIEDGFGNNPDPISFGGDNERCCDSCNAIFVIPLRYLRIAKHGKVVKED